MGKPFVGPYRPYAARQEGWIKENDVQVGDYVVVEHAPDNSGRERSWGDMSWTTNHHFYIGTVCRVECIENRVGVKLKSTTEPCRDLWFPFFVLRLKSAIRHPYTMGETVLRRDGETGKWVIDTFICRCSDKKYPYQCQRGYFACCIPMNGNEHLLGTYDSPASEKTPPVTTFAPFEKVLVRCGESGRWHPAHFSHWKDEEKKWVLTTGGTTYKYFIPYEGNEHLCGTSNAPGAKKKG